MAKKKEEVVTETTEKVEEPKTEEITSTGETEEVELAGDKIEAPLNEDAKVQATEEVELAGDKIEAPLNEDAKVQATENKVPTVKEVFRDKYDSKVVYNVGDTFVLDESLEDNKPVKDGDKQYKVSKTRYEELQRSLYVD